MSLKRISLLNRQKLQHLHTLIFCLKHFLPDLPLKSPQTLHKSFIFLPLIILKIPTRVKLFGMFCLDIFVDGLSCIIYRQHQFFKMEIEFQAASPLKTKNQKRPYSLHICQYHLSFHEIGIKFIDYSPQLLNLLIMEIIDWINHSLKSKFLEV